jgi:guanylate kinase
MAARKTAKKKVKKAARPKKKAKKKAKRPAGKAKKVARKPAKKKAAKKPTKKPTKKQAGKRAAKRTVKKAKPARRSGATARASRGPAGAAAGTRGSPPRGQVLPEVPRPRLVPTGTDGLLLVISGPSGAGKSTIARRLTERESRIWPSVSMTTRRPRPGELDGVDYFFVSREEFGLARDTGQLLEHATVHGELYGTPRQRVVERLTEGRDVLLEIDVQGASRVREAAPEAVTIFVMPPSREVLLERFRARGTEAEEAVAARVKAADEEVRRAGEYDYVVINDEIERAVSEVVAIVTSERNRAWRRSNTAW